MGERIGWRLRDPDQRLQPDSAVERQTFAHGLPPGSGFTAPGQLSQHRGGIARSSAIESSARLSS